MLTTYILSILVLLTIAYKHDLTPEQVCKSFLLLTSSFVDSVEFSYIVVILSLLI